jgi:hypothetical protein
MPAALYPPKDGNFEFTTYEMVGTSREPIKEYLLCRGCEQLFAGNGESEVLGAIAGKSMKRFPLHEKLRVGLPRESDPSVARFAGYDFNLDMDKFAYFALSVVWRGAVHQWKKFDGTLTTALTLLEGFEDRIRRYLLGETVLPPDIAVIVIVCSDEESRKSWYFPAAFVEALCLNFGFLARGVYFRTMIGPHIPSFFRDQCCTSPRRCIFYGDGERRTLEAFATIDAIRARGRDSGS